MALARSRGDLGVSPGRPGGPRTAGARRAGPRAAQSRSRRRPATQLALATSSARSAHDPGTPPALHPGGAPVSGRPYALDSIDLCGQDDAPGSSETASCSPRARRLRAGAQAVTHRVGWWTAGPTAAMTRSRCWRRSSHRRRLRQRCWSSPPVAIVATRTLRSTRRQTPHPDRGSPGANTTLTGEAEHPRCPRYQGRGRN